MTKYSFRPTNERTMRALMQEKQKESAAPVRYDIATDRFKPITQSDCDIAHEIYMRLYEANKDLVMKVASEVKNDKKLRAREMREKFYDRQI